MTIVKINEKRDIKRENGTKFIIEFKNKYLAVSKNQISGKYKSQ